MSAKIKIPKGWRRLRLGEVVAYHDKFWAWNEGPWKRFGGCVYDAAETIGTKLKAHIHPVIRRIPKTARRKKAK